MDLLRLHAGLADTLLAYTLAMAIWSFWLYSRRSDLSSQFWGAIVINELVFVAQILLGVFMVLQGRVPLRIVHYLYGVLSLITLPSAFAFTRGRSTYREALIYGVLLLFLAGVILRARITA